jgi:PAS domain S-box-containing protein
MNPSGPPESILARSHAQLQTALSAGLIATWYWELATDTVFADRNLSRLFAVSEAQGAAGLPLATFLAAIHPDDRVPVQAQITQTLASGHAYEAEYRVVDATGATRWVLARGQVEVDAAGQAVAFPGVLIDQTDRRRATRQFQENEQRLALAIDAAELGTWDYNLVTGELVWTDRCKALFGLPPEAEISYDVFLAGTHPDDRDRAHAAVQAALQPGSGPFRLEYRTVGFDDGRVRWVRSNGRALFDESGRAYRFLGTLLDITESKHTEAELGRRVAERTAQVAEAVQQLRLVLDASLNSIIAMTAVRDETRQIVDFRMDLANEAVLRSNFMRPEELIGKTLLDVFPGNRDSGFFDLYVRVVETGEAGQSTAYYRDDSGLEGWFEVSAVKQGTEGVVVTFMNVTERHLQEQRLQRSVQQLEEFAYVASHDLQEPLRKIQSFTDRLLLRHAATFEPGAIDLFERLQKAAKRMQALVSDLLAYSRLTPRQEKPVQLVDLQEVLTDVLDDLEAAVQASAAQLHADPLPQLPGDPTQLRQLLQNLITNALKFTKPGAAPHVDITAREVGRADLPQAVLDQKSERWLLLCVKDQGIGFDDQYRERIFQAFQRLHGRDEYEGTGIGLAIVQKVAERHGGLVTATGQPGEGAEFCVYLPMDQAN